MTGNCSLRVVLVSFSELPTMQHYLYLAAEELQRMGLDVWTLGSETLGISVEIGERNNLVATPSTPRPTPSSLFKAVKGAGEMAALIASFEPDVVHFVNKHTWNYFLIMALKKACPATKLVHTFHDPVGHAGDSIQKGVVLYHKMVQRKLDAVVVHSDVAQTQAVGQLRVPCPVCEVPLGVVPWRGWEDTARNAGKRALIFGRINAYKGVEYWPVILDELAKLDPKIKVIIAGKPSDDVSPELLGVVRAKPNATLIDRFIAEEEIDGLFGSCGVVLTPYTSITQSGVILDAYSRSRGIVAFDIEGVGQYLPAGTRLVPSFDCAAYARRVVELLSDLDELARYSESAWRFGAERFTPHAMATGLVEVYEATCGREGGQS